MSSRRTRDRRRYFLLDSNQTKRRKPKKLRNQTLNFLSRFRFVRFFIDHLRFSTILALLMVGMLAFILFALFSPFFQIKSISFTRDNPNIQVEEIEKKLESLYGKNLLFIDKETAISQLITDFPEFKAVEINEIWPDKVQIKIDLSEPVFTLFDPENASFAVISEDGVILSEQSRADLPVLELSSFGRPFVAGDKLMTTSQIQAIDQATKIMKEDLEVALEKIIFFPDAMELHLVSQSGTLFMLDLQLGVLSQLRKLEFSLDEINWREKIYEHIDLRIPERLYYK